MILTNGERYCTVHAAEYEARRGTPTRRGYGYAHTKKREALQSRIDAGETIRCVSCGVKLRGREWDLGHSHDRSTYIGPQCIPCNRRAGGAKGRARQK